MWWLSLAAPALGSPVEFYGFGGRKMGRAAAGTALADGPGTILANPAALPGLAQSWVSAGFVGIEADFADIPDVWWDTNRDGLVNEGDSPLQIDTPAEPLQGFTLGLVAPLGPTIAVGIAAFFPTERILRLETFEPQLPTYFLYDNRAQRYEIGLGAAWRPKWGISIGAGVQVIPRASYSLDATLDVVASGAEEGDTSASDLLDATLDVHSMTLDIGWGMAPIVGLHWRAGDATPVLEGLQVGACWRGEAGLPVDVDVDLQVNAATSDVGDLEDLVIPALLEMNLGVYDHYVPSQFQAGIAYTIDRTLTVSVDAKRTAWDQMQLSIAEVTHADIDGATIELADVADGNPYEVQLEATWSPRLGLDLDLPPIPLSPRLGELRISTRGGVGYEPTPLVSQTADSALLDADRVAFALGLGLEGQDPFRRPENRRAVRVDAFLQYHLLASGQLDRGTPEEPTPGYAVDGSAIPIGGHLLAAGAEFSLEY